MANSWDVIQILETDIDPVDPNQPKGMKRQKTDPTYNVSEDTKTTEHYNGIEISLEKEDDENRNSSFSILLVSI